MNYKQSSRSPFYGKVVNGKDCIAYDKNGLPLQEFDILKLVLVHSGREYKISELFELAAKSEVELAAHKSFIESLKAASEAHEGKIEKLQQTVETLSQLVVLLDAKINALSIK